MKCRKAFKVVGLVMLATTAMAGPLRAQSAEDDVGLRTNCADDYFKFCSAYQPGAPQLRQCFVSNFKRLSPACQAAMRDFDRRNPRRR